MSLNFAHWSVSVGKYYSIWLVQEPLKFPEIIKLIMYSFLIIIIIIIICLFTAIGLSPGGRGYFTCKQNMKLVITKFKSGGLHEKHVVATWNVGNRVSICL